MATLSTLVLAARSVVDGWRDGANLDKAADVLDAAQAECSALIDKAAAELTSALAGLPPGASFSRECILSARRLLGGPRLHALCAAVEPVARCAECRRATADAIEANEVSAAQPPPKEP